MSAAVHPTQITIHFLQSRSPRFPLLLELAQQLAHAGNGRFTEQTMGEGKSALRTYQITLPGVEQSSARSLLAFGQAIEGLAGTTIAVNELSVTWYRATEVLACYLRSFIPSDWRAHCWAATQNPFGERLRSRGLTLHVSVESAQDTERRELAQGAEVAQRAVWFFPCKLAAGSATHLELTHPATIRAQVEALLVSYECHWCPRLANLDDWDLFQFGR